MRKMLVIILFIIIIWWSFNFYIVGKRKQIEQVPGYKCPLKQIRSQSKPFYDMGYLGHDYS